MIKIKAKKGEVSIKMKGGDAEVLADIVFLLVNLGTACRDRIEKMPEEMRTDLRTNQIKAFVKTLNGEGCEETIKGIVRGTINNTIGNIVDRNI